MTEYILARKNGRSIPTEDKVFGTSSRAKAMIAEKGHDKVINATIGSLLDDDGNLVVLTSVAKVFKALAPQDYADYAPIRGLPSFREAVQKAAFGSYEPAGFTEAVATPGGTGSLRNVVSNYSEPKDRIITSDWHWAPYNTIAGEMGRSIETFELFTPAGKFNTESLKETVSSVLAQQESLVLIINTPAHNPTGYSLTLEDWDEVVSILTEAAEGGKPIALVVDAAYIDFAGDEEECRRFLPKLEELPWNVLPIIAYSLSKTFTLYGTRCGAMICMAKTEEIAEEFKRVCEFSSRGSWSNSAKVAQVVLSKIYSDPQLLQNVSKERAFYRDMLLARGRAFEEEAKKVGLEIVPFDAGFFASIPCSDPDGVSERLEKEGLFTIPLAKGIRVSIASISEEKCRRIPAMVKAAL